MSGERVGPRCVGGPDLRADRGPGDSRDRRLPPLIDEPRPFVFFGERTTTVRLFTIGPEHLDWLCAFCGRTGKLEGNRVSRWCLALDQLSIVTALEEHPISRVQERFDRVGWELAKRRCRRTAVEHLHTHLRFEQICGEDR